MPLVALITGGMRGIGRATALRLARGGVIVAFTYRTSTDTAAFETELAAVGAAGSMALETDVANGDSCAAAVAGVAEKFGRIDSLVNNAGVRQDALLYNMTPEQWREVLATNLDGAFYMTNAVLPIMMKQRSGGIVNVASLSGLHGVVGQANYAASKGGLIAFTRTVAREAARSGVRVNCVAPGLVETDMTATLDAETRKEMIRSIPMRRMLKADEVASVIAFLLSPESSGITGQVLSVDGGFVAQ